MAKGGGFVLKGDFPKWVAFTDPRKVWILSPKQTLNRKSLTLSPKKIRRPSCRRQKREGCLQCTGCSGVLSRTVLPSWSPQVIIIRYIQQGDHLAHIYSLRVQGPKQ